MNTGQKFSGLSARQQGLRAMLLGSAATVFATSPALAQDSDELAAASTNQPAIIVTGTRITNPNLEQSSPIQVVGQDEIDYRQATNAEELIGDLPGIAPGTNNSTNRVNVKDNFCVWSTIAGSICSVEIAVDRSYH